MGVLIHDLNKYILRASNPRVIIRHTISNPLNFLPSKRLQSMRLCVRDSLVDLALMVSDDDERDSCRVMCVLILGKLLEDDCKQVDGKDEHARLVGKLEKMVQQAEGGRLDEARKRTGGRRESDGEGEEKRVWQ